MATLFTIRTTTIIYSYGHWISKPKVHPQLIIGTVLSARELIEFLGKIVLASQFMCVWPKREINKRGIFGGISLLTGWNLLEYFVGANSDEMNHAPQPQQPAKGKIKLPPKALPITVAGFYGLG